MILAAVNWHFDWWMMGGGALLGFAVGVLTGLFGAGGGFIVTPALNIFMGLSMNLAVGTSACQIFGTSFFAMCHHVDRKLLGLRVALFTGIGIPLGSWLGALSVTRLKGLPPLEIAGRRLDAVNFVLLGIFAVFLILISLWLLYDSLVLSRRRDPDETKHRGLLFGLRIPPLYRFRTIPAGAFSIPVLILLGFFIGYMSGLLGIGGGVIMLPLLYYLVGQETKFAAKTSIMLVFAACAFATVFHVIDGNIDYPLVLALLAGSFFGTRIGARIQRAISGASIRRYFAFVVLAAALMVIFKLVKMLL